MSVGGGRCSGAVYVGDQGIKLVEGNERDGCNEYAPNKANEYHEELRRG